MNSIAETSSVPFSAPARPGRAPEGGRQRHRLVVRVERHERNQAARQRDHAQDRGRHDAERAFRADEEVDQIHARPRVVPGRQLCDVGHRVGRHRNPVDSSRLGHSNSNQPSGDAVTAPRRISAREPSASTTVKASTHGRVLPYLNVAAPAALVAIGAANKRAVVGRDGWVIESVGRQDRRSSARGTPAPTRTTDPGQAARCQ